MRKVKKSCKNCIRSCTKKMYIPKGELSRYACKGWKNKEKDNKMSAEEFIKIANDLINYVEDEEKCNAPFKKCEGCPLFDYNSCSVIAAAIMK